MPVMESFKILASYNGIAEVVGAMDVITQEELFLSLEWLSNGADAEKREK